MLRPYITGPWLPGLAHGAEIDERYQAIAETRGSMPFHFSAMRTGSIQDCP